MLHRSDFTYTPLFCEENIWMLCAACTDQGIPISQLSVIFISNPGQKVAVYYQQQVPQGQAVIWDYHVIACIKNKKQQLIYDFDTLLAFPCDYKSYLNNSFPARISKPYQAVFRVIPGQLFLNAFSSDRSHMQGKITAAEFPDYPPIISTQPNRLNLNNLLNVAQSIDGIKDYSLAEMLTTDQ